MKFAFTGRERRILELASEGFSTSMIAEECFATEIEVASDWQKICAKLGAQNRKDAVAIWSRCAENVMSYAGTDRLA